MYPENPDLRVHYVMSAGIVHGVLYKKAAAFRCSRFGEAPHIFPISSSSHVVHIDVHDCINPLGVRNIYSYTYE